MRKLVSLAFMAATILPTAAMANQWDDVRDARRDVREERRELDRAYRYGDRGDIREERGEYRDARREYREELGEARRYDRRHYGYGHHYRTRYALPNGGRDLRWVRRHDDALLINRYNGRVVRVVRNYYG
jgi:Ni/Co efflux regulator RcnB